MKKEQIVKKSLLVGVGVAAYAQDKANKIAGELLKKGDLSREEGKKLVRTVYREAEISGQRVAKVLESELKRILNVSGLKSSQKSRKKKKR